MFVFLKDISHYIIDKLAITAYIFLWQTVTSAYTIHQVHQDSLDILASMCCTGLKLLELIV